MLTYMQAVTRRSLHTETADPTSPRSSKAGRLARARPSFNADSHLTELSTPSNQQQAPPASTAAEEGVKGHSSQQSDKRGGSVEVLRTSLSFQGRGFAEEESAEVSRQSSGNLTTFTAEEADHFPNPSTVPVMMEVRGYGCMLVYMPTCVAAGQEVWDAVPWLIFLYVRA